MNQIIKKTRVRIDGNQPTQDGEAHVELLKDGDVVRALEVRCSCGAATVVELDYDDSRDLAPESR